MKFRTAAIIAAPFALALSGCGHADDASTEAEADTVEIPANEALQPIEDEPVADPNANEAVLEPTETPAGPTEQEKIQAAGDSAADTAAAAADAMADMGEEQKQQ